MLVFLAFTLALSSIPTDEVSLGINPETSPGMRNALLSDAFSRLDTNQDGYLTKAERKPLFDDDYVLIADLYVTQEEPLTVKKAQFVANVAVPDMGETKDPTEADCLLEAALVQISGDDIWRHLFGDKDSASVPEFASTLYDAMEKDVAMNLIEFIDTFTKPHGRFPFAPTADGQMHIYKVDSYTELHNQKCRSQRRNLLVSIGGISIPNIPSRIPDIPIGGPIEVGPDPLANVPVSVNWEEVLAPVISTASQMASQYCGFAFYGLNAACSAYNAFKQYSWFMPSFSTINRIMSSWNGWDHRFSDIAGTGGPSPISIPTSPVSPGPFPDLSRNPFTFGRRQLREKMAEAVQRKA